MSNGIRLPDAVNCSVSRSFTQVPNSLLRDPDLSFKAKGILCLLLSNKDGWTSYISSIKKMGKEGETAIRSALSELEESGYLMRLKYRDKITKRWVGSFWAYTDTKWEFYIEEHILTLEDNGYELDTSNLENLSIENRNLGNQSDIKNENQENQTVTKTSNLENLDVENRNKENLRLIIHNSKKKNIKRKKSKNTKQIFKDLERFLDNFPNKWKDDPGFQKIAFNFLQHRKEIKKPLTDRASKMLAKKLTKYSLAIAKKSLRASVENGWTGVFPESVGNNGSRNSKPINTCGSRAYQDDVDVSEFKYQKGEVVDVTEIIRMRK